MKLELDSAGCQGHGRCYTFAPGLFDADDEGHSLLLIADVPDDQQGPAREAAASCPEDVITLHE
ncbi:ferredoxin [Mycobacterium lentiflavum]|uniref:Ferredoxin n=1 Tax=Mycobacterium lentiflavum TaxID=141349 RepID=A0A0E4CMD7_MYCLN|nr:ferredoxin [Mycobacterium lentiflavum]CQD09071.1 ferredoxin [Mycobacterium lentiflavum]